MLLSQRRVMLDDVESITAYCENVSKYLNESELIERRPSSSPSSRI